MAKVIGFISVRLINCYRCEFKLVYLCYDEGVLVLCAFLFVQTSKNLYEHARRRRSQNGSVWQSSVRAFLRVCTSVNAQVNMPHSRIDTQAR